VIPSLAHRLAELAAELARSDAAVQSTEAGGTITWSRGDRPFAVGGPLGVEFRLDPAIAAAAARTPDAGPSPRGLEWVRFNPRELDGHAVDRVRAWLELAFRRAGEPLG
jgi:hypothetical protein